MAVRPSSSSLPNNGALLLLWAQTSSQVPLTVTFCSLLVMHRSLAPQAVFIQTTLALSLNLQRLSLSAQPLPKCLRLGCPGQWCI